VKLFQTLRGTVQSRSRSLLTLTLLIFLSALIGHASGAWRQTVLIANQKVNVEFGPREYGPDERASGLPIPPPIDAATMQKVSQEYIGVFQKIGEFSGGLKMPSILSLKLSSVEFDPSANFLLNQIQIGIRFGSVERLSANSKKQGHVPRVFTQHPNKSIAVAAHEFGHLIFAENVLPEIANMVRQGIPVLMNDPRYQKSQQLQKSAMDIKNAIERLQAGGADKSEESQAAIRRAIEKLAELGFQIQQLEQQLESDYRGLMQGLQVYDLTTPLNELYADVVAVLLTERPDVVAESIHMAAPNRGTRNQRDRRHSEIENRRFSKGRVGLDYVLSDHAVFHETRQHIWDRYLSRPSVGKREKAKVLEILTKVLRQNMADFIPALAQLKKTQSESASGNQIELQRRQTVERSRTLNRILIQKIDQAFVSQGL